jgi:hypothetical protein
LYHCFEASWTTDGTLVAMFDGFKVVPSALHVGEGVLKDVHKPEHGERGRDVTRK